MKSTGKLNVDYVIRRDSLGRFMRVNIVKPNHAPFYFFIGSMVLTFASIACAVVR